VDPRRTKAVGLALPMSSDARITILRAMNFTSSPPSIMRARLFSDVADHLKRVKNYKVWQDGNHPEMLTSAKLTRQKLNYLHNNPVKDEIVDEPEEYLFSSARDYYSNKKGCLEVDRIE
jgi:hypothetical protein